MQFAAPNYTHIAAGQTAAALTNVGTASVLIYGFIVDPTGGAGTVTLLEGDGSTVIQVITVPVGGPPFESKVLWLASRGFKITTSANATALVWHGNPSA